MIVKWSDTATTTNFMQQQSKSTLMIFIILLWSIWINPINVKSTQLLRATSAVRGSVKSSFELSNFGTRLTPGERIFALPGSVECNRLRAQTKSKAVRVAK